MARARRIDFINNSADAMAEQEGEKAIAIYLATTPDKKGLIEMADTGTLFLDEIGELGLDAQAKLLRFLEEGEFYRVGGVVKMKDAARVVSATNRDLEKMIHEGSFRKDLGASRSMCPPLPNGMVMCCSLPDTSCRSSA